MSQVFHNLIESLLSETDSFNRIWFAGDLPTPPQFSYQVNFPRLEMVMSGRYVNQIGRVEQGSAHGLSSGIAEIEVQVGEVLYIPPNCWNKPAWNSDCSVLSLLFGRRQLGFSLVSKYAQDKGFYDVQKYSVQTQSGHAMDHILAALNALSREQKKKPVDEHLLTALISYALTMLSSPKLQLKKRSEDIYQEICIYIQENFHRSISRSSIAQRFNISANHLSRLFRQQGHMTLADYITWVRIDRAKFMLKKYPFKLGEVALRCGYQDMNYFCRVFKNKTGKTPSEYRSLG